PSDAGTSFAVIRLSEDGDRLLHGTTGARQALLVDGQLGPARVYRLPEADDCQVGQLFGDRLEPAADVVKLTGHRAPPRAVGRGGGRRGRRPGGGGCSRGWR